MNKQAITNPGKHGVAIVLLLIAVALVAHWMLGSDSQPPIAANSDRTTQELAQAPSATPEKLAADRKIFRSYRWEFDGPKYQAFNRIYQQVSEQIDMEPFRSELAMRALANSELGAIEILIADGAELPIEDILDAPEIHFEERSDYPAFDFIYPLLRDNLRNPSGFALAVNNMFLQRDSFERTVTRLVADFSKEDVDIFLSKLDDSHIRPKSDTYLATIVSRYTPQQRWRTVATSDNSRLIHHVALSGPIAFENSRQYITARRLVEKETPLVRSYHLEMPAQELKAMLEYDIDSVLKRRLSVAALKQWEKLERFPECLALAPDFTRLARQAIEGSRPELVHWLAQVGSIQDGYVASYLDEQSLESSSVLPEQLVTRALQANDNAALLLLMNEQGVQEFLQSDIGWHALLEAVELDNAASVAILLANGCRLGPSSEQLEAQKNPKRKGFDTEAEAELGERSPIMSAIHGSKAILLELLQNGVYLSEDAIKALMQLRPEMLAQSVKHCSPSFAAAIPKLLEDISQQPEELQQKNLAMTLRCLWLVARRGGTLGISERAWRGELPWVKLENLRYRCDFRSAIEKLAEEPENLALLQLEGVPFQKDLLHQAVLNDKVELVELLLRDWKWVRVHQDTVEECYRLATKENLSTASLLESFVPQIPVVADDPFLALE